MLTYSLQRHFILKQQSICLGHPNMKNNKAPHYLKNLINSDQDFVTIVENLIANDTQEQAQLDKKDYQTAIISACIGTSGLDLFKKVVADAIKEKVLSVVEIREIVYQSQAYTGLANTYAFVRELSKYLGKNEIKVPKTSEDQDPLSAEVRLANGQEIQKTLFGTLPKIDEKDPAAVLQKLIRANCYGDFYSRPGLSLRLRELSAFSILVAMGDTKEQLKAHIRANYVAGNEYLDLIKVITAIVPFVGYVKAVNALGVLSLVKQDESVKPVVESKASLPSTKKEATPSKKEEKEATAKTEVEPTEKVRTPVSQNQRNQSKKKH